MRALFERSLSSVDSPRTIAHVAALSSLLVLAIVMRVIGFQGYSDADPRSYTVLAYDLANGITHLGSYDGAPAFPFRIAVYSPAAFLIRFFGLSEVSLVLYPFAISIASCVLAYILARWFWGPLGGLLCLGLWSVLPLDVKLASLLLPDAIAAFWANVAITLLFLGSRTSQQHTWAFVAGLCLGISWLCKETVVFLFPFLVFLTLGFDRERPIEKKAMTALAVVAGGGIIVVAEMISFSYLTGDPFLRLNSIEKNYREAALWFYDPSSPYFGWKPGDYARTMFHRLFTHGPVQILAFATGYLPAYGILGLIWMAFFARNRRLIILAIWLGSLFFMFNFMTISFQAYRPLPLFGRYLFPLLLPASICVAGFLRALLPQSIPTAQTTSHSTRPFWFVIAIATYVAISSPPLYSVIKTGPEDVEKAVAKMIKKSDVVFSDFRTVTSLVFFRTGSLLPSTPTTIPFEGLEVTDFPQGAYVLIEKGKIESLTRVYKYQRPAFVDAPPVTWKKVWTQGNVTLFHVTRSS